MSLVLLLVLANAAQPVPAKLVATAPRCPTTADAPAAATSPRPPLRQLNQLPPANAYNAVYRLVGGCEVPQVVRYGIGNRR